VHDALLTCLASGQSENINKARASHIISSSVTQHQLNFATDLKNLKEHFWGCRLISVPDVWVCFRCAEIKDQSDGARKMMKKTHWRAHPNIWCSSYHIHGITYLVME
jgi:hypothetical protein